MTGRIAALLVRDPGEHWGGLRIALHDQSIETSEVRTSLRTSLVSDLRRFRPNENMFIRSMDWA
jgi:hypothetical protein